MGKFLIREVNYNNINQELNEIGFDKSYLLQISDKFKLKNLRIYNLSFAQANILKQTALIFGADCATNRNVITGNIEYSDVILCGSYSQLKKISQKLKSQPFKLAILGDEILQYLEPQKRKTKLAGILNITQDSFSDGGLYFKPEAAIEHARQMINEGADIIDIGAESTRPYSSPIDEKEQIQRIKPVLEVLANEITISIDTRSSIVADFALNNGAKIINDVSGFDYDKRMAEIVSKHNAGIIIQHSTGNAENTPNYNNIVNEIFISLKNKIEYAQEKGINNIIIDPGIGFGKSKEDNLKIFDNITSFYSLQTPIMVGLSRKRFLGIENDDNNLKDALSLAYSYSLIQAGVDYLRVHNVKMHKTLLNSIPN